MDKIYVFIGGHAVQNNGYAGIGLCFHTDPASPPFYEEAEHIGVETQNSSVYRAIIRALQKAREWNIKRVEIYSDNRLVVGQLGDSMLARARSIRPLHEEVRKLAGDFEDYTVSFVPGRSNIRAKELARIAAAASPDKASAQAISFEVAPGITGLVLAFTPKLMTVRFKYKKGAAVPEHSHGHEQAVYVAGGSLKYVVGDREVIVGKGAGLVLSGHTRHRIEALADTTEIVTYYPMREDLLKAKLT